MRGSPMSYAYGENIQKVAVVHKRKGPARWSEALSQTFYRRISRRTRIPHRRSR